MEDFTSPSVKYMLKEISDTAPITREEEYALFFEYDHERTTEARKSKIRSTIIMANMRFALKICLNYKHHPNVHMADLIGEAKIGLLNAFNRFDYRTDNKFISYAVWHIKARISKFLEENNLIRLPSHQKVKLNKERKEKDVNDFDDDTLYLHIIEQGPISLDMPLNDEDSTELNDVIADTRVESDERIRLREKLKKEIKEILPSILDTEECIVISKLFGINSPDDYTYGLRETSNVIGKSHERVRQVRDKAIRKLRKHVPIQDLKDLMIDYAQEFKD